VELVQQSWVTLRSEGTGTLAFQLTSARTWMPTYYLQIGMSGHYRATVYINWKNEYHQWIGGRVYTLNAAHDYSCEIAGCQVGSGWIYLAR
jgi:hypothetical protein